MLSRVTAKNVGDVFLRHTVDARNAEHKPGRTINQARLLLRPESKRIWPAVKELHFEVFPYISRSVTPVHPVQTTNPMEFI